MNKAIRGYGARTKRSPRYRVAVVEWMVGDELAAVICDELENLGHMPDCFPACEDIPAGADIVFSFAPYGKFLPIVKRLADLPKVQRPLLVHWNTEGIPDLRIPWPITKSISHLRSWIDRIRTDNNQVGELLANRLSWLDSRMLRFRYIGDYHYAHTSGILTVLADTSMVYTRYHNQHGLPVIYAPWGSTPRWHAEMKLERDIDVLWMGKRGSKRRSDMLDRVRNRLAVHGVDMYVADNEEHPFVFGEKRTHFLNRAKITLNLTRTWYDDNFSRFALAAPNRSLIVSEEMLPHCPAYQPGFHYVAVPPKELATAVLHCLQHPEKREQIIENACRLTTSTLTFGRSVQLIMEAVENLQQ